MCAKASEEAQEMRSAGRLRSSRGRLRVCIRDVCPGVIRADCATWLAEVEAAMPTVVIDARDAAGHDVVDVEVTVDGEPFAGSLDGKALAIDPGAHTFRYERRGAEVVEQDILIREGQKDRLLDVTLKSPAANGPPVAAFALAAVAVASTVGYAYFGISAQQGADNLRRTCAPKCAESSVDDLRGQAVAANVLFGVAVVAVAGAAVAWLTHSTEPAKPGIVGGLRLDASVVPHGGVATLGAVF